MRRDDEAACGIEIACRQPMQPSLDGFSQNLGLFKVEAQLDFGRNLVDVLASRPGRAHGAPFEVGGGDSKFGGNEESFHVPKAKA